MKIIKYAYKDVEKPGWKFSEVELSGINLIVGDTASGKTRFLNTIFNLGEFVKGKVPKSGNWKITFEHKNNTYTWELIAERLSDISSKRVAIKKDYVWKHNTNGSKLLIERDSDSFLLAGTKMPKLSQSESSIGLLKEDDNLKPLYEAFSIIRRRVFSTEGLNKVSEIDSIKPNQFLPKTRSEKQILRELFDLDLGINATMYFIRKYSYKTFKSIINAYRSFFPLVKDIKIGDFSDLQVDLHLPGKSPVIMIQEVGQEAWIPLMEMSSGMQKVLLILVDVYLLPEGGVYIIDEYENSLGVSAIDFFPEFVLEIKKEIQFFITSHHPYLINKIPINNWCVFHREGLSVTIRYGKELVDRYGKSKQQAFLQLLNDPFYSRELA